MFNETVRTDSRLAGGLIRYHVWPQIGRQTNAEHTWNVLRIYCHITKAIDANVMHYIVFHDIGEWGSGDLPYPLKRDDPVLKELINGIEDKTLTTMFEYWGGTQAILTDEQKTLVKHIELIEMAEWGMDQLTLGNDHGYIVADVCLEAVYASVTCIPLIKYVIKRFMLFYRYKRNQQWCQSEWWKQDHWEKLHDIR